jgi:hypothetical protein
VRIRYSKAAYPNKHTVMIMRRAIRRSGFWRESAEAKNAGALQKTAPTLCLPLAFIAGEECRWGPPRLGAFRRREDATTLRVHPGRGSSEGGGERSCARGDDWGRLGALAWSSTRAIPWAGAHRNFVEERGVSAWRTRRQRWRRLRCTGKRQATACLARGPFPLALCAPGLVDRARRLDGAVLRVDQPPAWGDPAIARRHPVRARALRQRGQALRIGLGQHRVRGTERCRDAWAPRAVGLGELLESVCAVSGPLGHEGGQAVGRLQRRPGLLDHLAELARIAAIATARWPQARDAGLLLDSPLPHALVQVGPMIPTVASGDGQDLRLGLLLTVRAAIDMEAGALERRAGGGKAQARGGGGSHEAVECRPPRGGERLQGTPERGIVALTGLKSRREEPSARCRRQKMRDEGARLIDEAQTVEPPGFDRMAGGHKAHGRVLRRGRVDDLGDPECCKHARDKAKGISDLRAVWWWLRRDVRTV